MDLNQPWWIDVPKVIVVINVLLLAVAYVTWLERKLIGRMQLRYGPNRAGPYGLLQPIADLVKMIRKESFVPATAIDVPATSPRRCWPCSPRSSRSRSSRGARSGRSATTTSSGWVADVPIALVLMFALGSIGIYGFIVGGWASDSKYSLLGSMRTCAQIVSYEVALALSVLGVVLMAGSLVARRHRRKQQETVWYAGPQFVGFLVFFIAGVAETNRAPFDLPEAESELVAGYHTEYGGMRWGLFQLAEYVERADPLGARNHALLRRLGRARACRARSGS